MACNFEINEVAGFGTSGLFLRRLFTCRQGAYNVAMRVFDPTAGRREFMKGLHRPPGRAKDTTLAGCIIGGNAVVRADREAPSYMCHGPALLVK